ncbi:MAG: GAF domain-containing protein [bacterium]|nr:GAF domain-containing protein [bacterium]
MVQFDNQYRQIKVKIVYYGPALGGKTTCLQRIHGVSDPEQRTKLYSLNTASDRTLFFDLLSLDLGSIRGYRLAIQLYTVPGQVQYNATRRAVLSGADGVVFVADSQPDQRQANKESFENLGDNLIATGLNPDRVPLVFQYNKRDLSPLMTMEELDADLNSRKVPAFPSVATTGEGVMEGFATISETTLVSVADKLGVGSRPVTVDRLREQVHRALKPYLEEAVTEEVAADDIEVTRPQLEDGAEGPMDEDGLVGEAVRANLAMTDMNVRLDTTRRQLERKVEVLAGVSAFSDQVGGSLDPPGVLRILLTTAARLLKVQAGSVLVVAGTGQLRNGALHALKTDPMLGAQDDTGETLASSIAAQRKPLLIDAESEDGLARQCLDATTNSGFGSAIAVPMVARDEVLGLLMGYRKGEDRPLDEDDLQLASVIAASSAQAYTTARTWHRLEELNQSLESQVQGRTSELNESLAEVRRLADELKGKNELVEKAYRELTELDHLKQELLGRISEELRTPVSSLSTAAKLLHENPDAPRDKTVRFTGVIQEQAEALTELVQSMLQASVLSSSRGTPAKQSIPIQGFFKRTLTPLRDLANSRDVRIHIAMASGLDFILCDPEPMETAIRALIKNGIIYSPSGGETRVEVRRVSQGETPWLRLTIADSGPGIPADELPHVCEAFWQGSAASSNSSRGIGLGLAIAKKVIEGHRGKLAIKQRDPQGCEVTVVLPLS